MDDGKLAHTLRLSLLGERDGQHALLELCLGSGIPRQANLTLDLTKE
eukprot:gene4079-4461_t